MMSAASMFGILDESINEMPVLVASLNQWGATIESDRSMIQENVESGFAEITTAILQIRCEVLTQGANLDDVRNHTIRLEQRMEKVEQIGTQAMTELATLMNGYQHKFVEMEGAINALAASAESNLKARQGQLIAELQQKFLELGGNDETVKADMGTLKSDFRTFASQADHRWKTFKARLDGLALPAVFHSPG